jgi:hypothetical protein
LTGIQAPEEAALVNESSANAPQPGDICLTWVTGWKGLWVSVMQWLSGEGGLHPWRRVGPGIPRGYPTRAAVILPDGQVLEAKRGGAAIGKLSRYRRRPVLHAALPLSDDQRAYVFKLAQEYVGTTYSWADYLYLALWRLRIRPQRLRDAITDNERMICSQLCDNFAERLGLHLFTDERLERAVTPGDLFRLFEGNGWWRKPS